MNERTSLINTRGLQLTSRVGPRRVIYVTDFNTNQAPRRMFAEALSLPSAGVVFDTQLTSSYPNLFCGFTHFLLSQLLLCISTYDYQKLLPNPFLH